MTVHLGRQVTGDLDAAEAREWIVTNGVGGYASGTVAGSIARGYHGLLVASLSPPVDRRLMLVKLEERARYLGRQWPLTTNRWASGEVSPDGYRNILHFELEGAIPCWHYALGDAVLEKRIWMEQGANTTYVEFFLRSGSGPLELECAALVDNRVFHNTGQVAWPCQVQALPDGARVAENATDARPLTLRMAGASCSVASELYRDFWLPREADRGLRASDDHVHAASFSLTLAVGQRALFVASAEDDPSLHQSALGRRRSHENRLLQLWRARREGSAQPAPPWVEQLVLAADQFIVDRSSPGRPDGKSVVAGYHWFGDWGRDTMISLPGLTLSTGRTELAAPILETFAQYVDRGMLPNRFPDSGETPEYNTVDATLWYFEAIRAYFRETQDEKLLRRLFPTLRSIIEQHVEGTRYGIRVDADDGLLRAGESGVQLTWMDAKVGDRVITPRIGKPIEVSALWYNAVCVMQDFAARLGESEQPYASLAQKALAGFSRFWNDDAGYCFDVLDGPHGDEAALRPNQVIALALPHCAVAAERRRPIVDACAQLLLSSCGLRSLAPGQNDYRGTYGGDQLSRDSAYHQGTVWAWLIGPFVASHLRVYKDPEAALRLLEPFADHLSTAGLGTISEIFDGDAPFAPKGCIAQAWSVAEVLRAFERIERAANGRGAGREDEA